MDVNYYMFDGFVIDKTTGRKHLTHVVRKSDDRFYDGNGKPVCGARRYNIEPTLPYGRIGYCSRTPTSGRVRCAVCDKKRKKEPIQSLPDARRGVITTAIPSRLRRKFESAFNDPDLLDQSEIIALLNVRIADLLERVDTGESGDNWRQILKTFEEFQYAINTQDVEATNKSMNSLESLISTGVGDYQAWDEIYKVTELLRKVKADENALILKKGAMITAEEQMSIIYYMLGIITKHVRDRDALDRIKNDVLKLMDKNQSMGEVKVIEHG